MARFLATIFAVLIAATLLSCNVVLSQESGAATAEAVVAENGEAEVVVESDAAEDTTAEEEEEEEEEEEKEPEDPKCPSRPHIIRCAAASLDKNKNDKLERAELQEAIDALPWFSRGVLKILGSVDKIMEKCDADGDDAIGMFDDMEKTKEQCLASCFKRKAFKGAFFPECDL
mmetsp:Transcript_26194/g.53662  ORF Transcript_26194/g.53662 Transcript_26194/m.53662 type:complete len:173 (-) Transcript_26194:525-1043(-)